MTCITGDSAFVLVVMIPTVALKRRLNIVRGIWSSDPESTSETTPAPSVGVLRRVTENNGELFGNLNAIFLPYR